jgi:hypothetical protein
LILGYFGRRSIYEVLRRLALNVAMFERGDVTIVDAGYRERGDVVLECSDFSCIAVKLFSSLPGIVGGGRLGLDPGAVRNGVVYALGGEPVLHAVLGAGAVREILARAGCVDVHVGASQYASIAEALLLSRCATLHVVDEPAAARMRGFLRARYPELKEDEIDALSFTYHDGVVIERRAAVPGGSARCPPRPRAAETLIRMLGVPEYVYR